MMEVGIQDQEEEIELATATEGSSPLNVSDLAASNSTTQSSSSAIISVNSGNYVLLKLLQREQAYTPILQKIFLYLDPKSLKNCKLTCSQWKAFIDTEIWGSISARKVLHSKLLSNWKDEDFVKVSKINLCFRVSCVCM